MLETTGHWQKDLSDKLLYKPLHINFVCECDYVISSILISHEDVNYYTVTLI